MSGIITNTQGCLRAASGLGDSTLSLWYEPFEDASPWRIKALKDMVPSVNIGPSLLIPLGISPYDDVENSFDVCGRGFYRIDGNLLIEKTLQPWNLSFLFSYGKYIERPVNREYGKYVEPYDKAPGDRISTTVSLSYAYYIGSGGDTLTGSLSYTYLQEKDGDNQRRRHGVQRVQEKVDRRLNRLLGH